LGFLFEWIGGH
jgi:hypothetical protein